MVIDAFPVDVGDDTHGAMDRGVVHHKSDFPMADFGELTGESTDALQEGFRSEGAVSVGSVLDPVMADAHQQREVGLAVCRHGLDWRLASF